VYAFKGRMSESQVLKKLVENATFEVGVLGRVHTKVTETETKHKQDGNKSEATIHTHTDPTKRNHLLDVSVFYPVQRQWAVAVK